MIEPEVYYNEKERLKDLNSYSILDSLPDSDYDNLTAIAAEICGTPISLISLIDDRRQWFKSNHGLSVRETPKEYAFCAHAINDPKNVFIIEDARKDERFHDNPLVTSDPYVIFYAGIPLISEQGMPLGTICVIDNKPNVLTKSQLESLYALSKQVMNLLTLRKKSKQLEQTLEDLVKSNYELERFAFLAAHDIKSPLVGIMQMAQLFISMYGAQLDSNGQKMVGLIENSVDELRKLVDGLLEYSRIGNVLKEEKSIIELEPLKEQIINAFPLEYEFTITLKSKLKDIYANKTVIYQVLIHLVTNAIKYSDQNHVEIDIEVSENDMYFEFSVKDNGPGIDSDCHKEMFEQFKILVGKDKFGKKGSGLGLAIVKKIVEKSGGSIRIESEIEKGAKILFTIEK